MFYGFPFYNTCLNLFNISCLFCGVITTSSTFVEFLVRFWFQNSVSDLVSYEYTCCFSCSMDYILEAVFRACSSVLVALSIIVWCSSCKWQNFIPVDVFSCSRFYRITYHFYLLISNIAIIFWKHLLSSTFNR